MHEALVSQVGRGAAGQFPPQIEASDLESAAHRWFGELEAADADRPFLFCLDEYESLEVALDRNREDVRRVIRLLRSVLRYRNVRIVLSGAHEYEQLGGEWRQLAEQTSVLHLEELSYDAVWQLLANPREDFPGDVFPACVVEEVFRRTGGAPLLTQRFGRALVDRLNRTGRRQASIQDVVEVQDHVFSRW